MKRLFYILGLLTITSNGWAVNIHHKLLADEFNGAITPYITLYSTYTQKIAATDAVQYIELNSSYNGDGKFTQISKSTWAVVDPGVYEFCYSCIADITGLPAGNIEFWGRIDGVDVPDSNTKVSVVTAAIEQIVAMCWVGPLNAGSTFAAMTYGTDTDLQWLYTAAQTTPARPAVPSIVMTVKKVSGLH
jgi:hypothetical protein